MGDKGGKKPKAKEQPGTKGARAASDPEDNNQLTPVWSITCFDLDGEWGKNRVSEEGHLWGEIFPKLKNYETMTWGKICENKHHNHYVGIDQLDNKARRRLEELNFNDIDALFRFRLSGVQRLWGIRDGRVFKLLWWDPEHEVCPSHKKHT